MAAGSATPIAVRIGTTVIRRIRSALDPAGTRARGTAAPASGWLVVTVYKEPSEVDTEKLPAPLAEYGDRIEVRVGPAPGGKGAELAARLRTGSSGSAAGRLAGTDAQADLRSALRRAKQLIEVGEVLVLDPVPHGERPATPTGALLEAWTRQAPKAGVR